MNHFEIQRKYIQVQNMFVFDKDLKGFDDKNGGIFVKDQLELVSHHPDV